MLQSINLQKSLEKLALLNMIQEKVKDSKSLIGVALRLSSNTNPDNIFNSIKDCATDNYKMMAEELGEPLLCKMLTH